MEDSSDLSTIDKALMKEIYEFLSQRDPSWSLGRNHLNFLHKLVLENDHWGVDALFILQKLVLVEDIVELVKNDPNSMLKDILEKFEDILQTKKVEVVKMVSKFLLQDNL